MAQASDAMAAEWRRFPCQILHRILQLVDEGHSKTRILYGANLSHALLVRYLGVLQDRGFVVANEGRYALTEAGRSLYRDVGKLARALEGPEMPPANFRPPGR